MTCEYVYQSVRCCEFSGLNTIPCQNFTFPQTQMSGWPMATSADPWIAMKHAPINRKVLGDSLQCHFSEEPCIGGSTARQYDRKSGSAQGRPCNGQYKPVAPA